MRYLDTPLTRLRASNGSPINLISLATPLQAPLCLLCMAEPRNSAHSVPLHAHTCTHSSQAIDIATLSHKLHYGKCTVCMATGDRGPPIGQTGVGQGGSDGSHPLTPQEYRLNPGVPSKMPYILLGATLILLVPAVILNGWSG